MPGGWPPTEREREACARVLLACEGDLDRIIDAPALDDEAYARHVARIPFSKCPDIKPLFFIAHEVSAQRIMTLRARVLQLTRNYDRSIWLICLAPGQLDGFIEQAADWAGIEEVVAEGLFAWRTSPWPMLVVDWSKKGADIAAALTSIETAPESGFIATVAGSHARATLNAEGAVVSLESLARMRAMPYAPPARSSGDALRAPHDRSGERGTARSRQNPRVRRSGR